MSTCCSKHVEAWNKHIEKECIKLVIIQNHPSNIWVGYPRCKNSVPITTSRLDPNVFLSTPFSYITSLSSSFTVTDEASCPYYKYLQNIYFKLRTFLESKLEDTISGKKVDRTPGATSALSFFMNTIMCLLGFSQNIWILPQFKKKYYYNLHVTSLSCIQFVRKFTQSINTNILCKEVCMCNDAIVLVFYELYFSTEVIQAEMNVILRFRTDKEPTHLVSVAKLHGLRSEAEIIIPRGCYLWL